MSSTDKSVLNPITPEQLFASSSNRDFMRTVANHILDQFEFDLKNNTLPFTIEKVDDTKKEEDNDGTE